jgi:predicted nucleic acid-binding protein
MTVVSDTTTLTTLLKAGMQNLLLPLFGEIQVPPSVYRELLAFHSHVPGFVRVVQFSEGVTSVGSVLGRGETEAIELAQQIKADFFLCDDRKARAAARQVGLNCRGILWIILQAKSAGLITSAREAIEQVECEGGLYLSETVKAEALRLAGE